MLFWSKAAEVFAGASQTRVRTPTPRPRSGRSVGLLGNFGIWNLCIITGGRAFQPALVHPEAGMNRTARLCSEVSYIEPDASQTQPRRPACCEGGLGYACVLTKHSHIPVLLVEILDRLAPQPGEVYADCTAGLGGHAAAVGARLAPGGRVVLNDADAGNLERAAAWVAAQAPGVEVRPIHGNFASLPRRLAAEGGQADAVLADLGFASNQMDDPERGFAFSRDGPLDMRLDPSAPTTAADLVMTLPEDELVRILREYGEEKAARPIARKIIAARQEGPIATTAQLAAIVRRVVRTGGGIDPATRTFQALRIAVNDELGSLEGLLAAVQRGARMHGEGWLAAGARVAIVSFHSLEDRMVKRAFGALVRDGHAEPIGRQPTMASEAEISSNPRSRSAKLRAIRLIETGIAQPPGL